MADDELPSADIRHAYCDTGATIAEICRRFDLTPARLTALRRRQGWPARPSAVAAIPLAKAEGAKPSAAPRATGHGGTARASARTNKRPASTRTAKGPRRARPTAAAKRAAMIERLYDAIDLKLTQLETQMTGNPDTTSADHEREVRALSTLIQTFERVSEIDPAARSARDPAGHPKSNRTGTGGDTAVRSDPAALAAAAADTERLRREIAERVERLMEKRNPHRTPG